MEHLQQPFYSKFIAVSNHYPYSEFKDDEAGFPMADTADTTINGYFATANYLDKAVEEFFNYLKASGLYDNSVIVLYGDHFGISRSRNKDLAELVGKEKDQWSDFDDAQMQRVPVMYHIPGQTNGFVSDTFVGQVDMLPTLLHLLGIDSKPYLFLGQDMLSKEHENLVAFRNGDFMTPKYTVVGKSVYDNQTQLLIEELTPEQQQEIDALTEKVEQQLSMSDALTNGDLLRFYTDSGLTPVNPDDYDYKNAVEKMRAIENEKGDESTSLYSKNGGKSTVDLYSTKSFQEYYGPVKDETTSSSSSQ